MNSLPRAGGRYGIYFAPTRRSALGRFGHAWLDRDAVTGADMEVPGISPERLAEITAEPRIYGFHATLKPPFAIAAGQSAAALDRALAAFAAVRHSFLAPSLQLTRLDGFWALTFAEPSAAADRLAADCVARFDHFRAPPSQGELKRRRRAGLSRIQEALLQRWGYPYVFQEFRFHMTLTARLTGAEAPLLGAHLVSVVGPLCRRPLSIDAVALFHQPAPGARFRLLRRYPLLSER
jgi:putative phosphonate metabolism protein